MPVHVKCDPQWVQEKCAAQVQVIHQILDGHPARWVVFFRVDYDGWSLGCSKPISKIPVRISSVGMDVENEIRRICIEWQNEYDATRKRAARVESSRPRGAPPAKPGGRFR